MTNPPTYEGLEQFEAEEARFGLEYDDKKKKLNRFLDISYPILVSSILNSLPLGIWFAFVYWWQYCLWVKQSHQQHAMGVGAGALLSSVFPLIVGFLQYLWAGWVWETRTRGDLVHVLGVLLDGDGCTRFIGTTLAWFVVWILLYLSFCIEALRHSNFFGLSP